MFDKQSLAVYYDVPAPKVVNETVAQTRDDADDGGGNGNTGTADEEDDGDGTVDLIMDFSDRFASSRLFEIRVAQIPFSQRAPAGCMQYFTGTQGVIQTFNFAENGRHLANQNYRACVRQETGMCSIQYEPCFDQSFRIGPRRRIGNLGQLLPGGGGPGSGGLGGAGGPGGGVLADGIPGWIC